MSDEIEFTFGFTDVTMLEADGEYDAVKEIMESEEICPDDWMIRSGLTIDSNYGIASMVVHFHADRRAVIREYAPSVGDVFYNPDVGAISSWAQHAGWRTPEPSVELVRESIEFWKHYWETLLVDSEYLDDVYGVRPHAQPENQEQ